MPIARGQRRAQAQALRAAQRRRCLCVVFDTDLASTVVYAQTYYGRVPPTLDTWARQWRADIYILCSPVAVPWLADDVRDRRNERDKIHECFAQQLARGAIKSHTRC